MEMKGSKEIHEQDIIAIFNEGVRLERNARFKNALKKYI